MDTVTSPQALHFSARVRHRPSVGAQTHAQQRLSVFAPLSVSRGIHPQAHPNHYFLRGTDHQTSLMRDPHVLIRMARHLLARFPLGSRQARQAPLGVRIHGASDGRESVSFALALLQAELSQRQVQHRDSSKQKHEEKGLLKQLGKQFRVTSIEHNAELVARGRTGLLEITTEDNRNLGHPVDFTSLFHRHCRVLPTPQSRPSVLPLVSTERYLQRAAGTLKQGDMFDDIAKLNTPQVAIFARNSLGYTPKRYAEYVQALGKALVPGGLFAIGQFETNYPNSEEPAQGTLVELLHKAGLRPLSEGAEDATGNKLFIKQA